MMEFAEKTIVPRSNKKAKEHIDFTIDSYSDGYYEDVVLRFYPRRSHVHGYADTCPNCYAAVYKDYLSYGVLEKTKDNKEEEWKSRFLFEVDCDECSPLFEVQAVLKKILNSFIPDREYCIRPQGYGAMWIIRPMLILDLEELGETGKNKYILNCEIMLFRTIDCVGYRFVLSREQIEELQETIVEYLKECLSHSEPI